MALTKNNEAWILLDGQTFSDGTFIDLYYEDKARYIILRGEAEASQRKGKQEVHTICNLASDAYLTAIATRHRSLALERIGMRLSEVGK